MKYVNEVLSRFDMTDCNSAKTPLEGVLSKAAEGGNSEVDSTEYKQIIGSLRYLCHSRPDILYATGIVTRFMNKPLKEHLWATKRILRYLKGTLNFGVWFPKDTNLGKAELTGFSYSDWCGDQVDRKSTSGFLFNF